MIRFMLKLGSSNREIKNMNKGKVGAPFEYSEKDVCLYKIPYRPHVEGEEFYIHETENHG
jgi:hypothetical protein